VCMVMMKVVTRLMVIIFIVLMMLSWVVRGGGEILDNRELSECVDLLDPSSEFSCSQAELGISYSLISSCYEDLSTNPAVQQWAPGATGTLCDVCCATCSSSFGYVCGSDGSGDNNGTIPAPPDSNCTVDTIYQFNTDFTCEHGMEALQVGIIESCEENLSLNPIIQTVYPEAAGTLCDFCCASCEENQQSCTNYTGLPNSTNTNVTESPSPTDDSDNDEDDAAYECIPRVPESLPDFCYACEFGPSPTCVTLIFELCTKACTDPTFDTFECDDCEARAVNMSSQGLELRLTEVCGYNNSRYTHECYTENALEAALLCETAPTCERGFTATMCRAVSPNATCPICKWSCEIPTIECSPDVFLSQAACDTVNMCIYQSCPILDLSSMSITNISDTFLVNLTHVHTLNLRNNSIRTAINVRFPVSILSLDISENPLESLDDSVFCEALYLQELDMGSTNGALLGFQPSCNNALEYLRVLSLASNNIQDLSSDMFLDMRMLEELDLRNNRFTSLPTPVLESSSEQYVPVCQDTPPFPNGTFPWWSDQSGCSVVQSILNANPQISCTTNLSMYVCFFLFSSIHTQHSIFLF